MTADNLTLHMAEEERQVVLLALAELAARRPGWDDMLNRLACQIDNVGVGRALLYEIFRESSKRDLPR